MSNRRVKYLFVGAAMIAVDILVSISFQGGSCSTGPFSGSCTTGPEPFALLIGIVLVVAGIAVMDCGGRPKAHREPPCVLPQRALLASCSASKAEENERSTFKLRELRRSESPHSLGDVGPSHRRQFVDHQKAGLGDDRSGVSRDRQP